MAATSNVPDTPITDAIHAIQNTLRSQPSAPEFSNMLLKGTMEYDFGLKEGGVGGFEDTLNTDNSDREKNLIDSLQCWDDYVRWLELDHQYQILYYPEHASRRRL